MKKSVSILGVCVLFIVFFTKCNKIEGPYLENSNSITVDVTDSFAPLSTNYFNKVLLEDYTGIKCVNCPGGSQVAHGLKALYGDTLLLVEIHCGTFADPDASGDFTADYRTTPGNTYNSFFSMSAAGLPCGMVNRLGYPSTSNILPVSSWSPYVAAAKAKKQAIALQIFNQYHTSGNINTFIKASFRDTIRKNLNLAVLVLEDSLKSPQRNGDAGIGPTPIWTDYWHTHVLRDAVNNPWGSPLTSTDTITHSNTFLIKGYTYQLHSNWKHNLCSILVFVYDKDTYEIYQVEEASVIRH